LGYGAVYAPVAVTIPPPWMQDVLDLNQYPRVSPISSAVLDAFGAFVTILADVGVDAKLKGIWIHPAVGQPEGQSFQFEIAQGAIASEVVISRGGCDGTKSDAPDWFPFDRTIADNERLSVRVRDQEALANTYRVTSQIQAIP